MIHAPTCDRPDSADAFGGYVDNAALLAAWPLHDDNAIDLGVIWSLDPTGGVNGTAALKVIEPAGTLRSGIPFFSSRVLTLTGLDPDAPFTLEAQIKTNWDVEVPPEGFVTLDGVPGIILTNALGPGTHFEPATSAAHGEWETVQDNVPATPNGSGEIYLICAVTNGARNTERVALFDNIKLLNENGELVRPCAGGLIIPGLGGWDPTS